MKILKPFEATTVNQTNPGDLIRLVGPHHQIGLIIHKFQGRCVVAVLQTSSGAAPYHIIFDRDPRCFRYTDGWVLDLPKDRAQFSATGLSETAGVIHLGRAGALLNLDAAEPQQARLTVSLDTFDWEQVSNHDAAFPSWRIWSSVEDMRDGRATPIIEFNAPS